MINKSTLSKSLWTVVLMLSFIKIGWSQINVNVLLQPPYSPYVADYLALQGKAVATVTNTSTQEYRVKFAGSIEGLQNGITGRTDPNYRPSQPIILRGGETKFINADNDIFGIKRSDIITNLSEQQQNGIIQSGILPEGDYKYCIQVLDYNTGRQLSNTATGCTIVSIKYSEAPMLIAPLCGSDVFQREPQNMTFTWSPVVNKPRESVLVYDLFLLKILNDQQDPQDLMNAAIKFGSGNPIKISNIAQNNYILTPIDPLLQTGKYAWAVQVRDILGRAIFQNNGISQVCTFMLRDKDGLDGEAILPPLQRAMCSCNLAFPQDNLGKNSPIKGGSKVKVGNFEMTVVDVNPVGKKLSGTGKINLPVLNSQFIPVRVSFEGMTVNAAGQMLEGTVTALKRPDGAGLMPNANPLNPSLLPFSSNQAQNLDQYFKANAEQLVSQAGAVARSVGLELPLGLDKNGAYTIAIMDLRLTPSEAVFDAGVAISLPDGSITVALGAKNVCVNPSNLCGQAILYLSQDLNMQQIGLTLKGADPENLARNPGTYVVFDRDGFKNFHIKAEYTFPASTIVRKDNGMAVAATLEADCLKWTDWIASITMPEFYISGMRDFSFSMESGAFYDHSSLKNPQNLPTIEGLDLGKATWMGFYLSVLKVKMPEAFKTIDNQPITFTANNLIIDNFGVSGSLNANDVLRISDGSVGGWYFSIDRIGVDFLKNSFTQGGLFGKIILPISGDNPADPGGQLDYKCTLSHPQGGSLAFQFAVIPKENLKVPVFIAAMNIKQSSSILLTANTQGFNATANLAGDLSIETREDRIGNIAFKLIEVEKFWISNDYPYVQLQAKLNSPQRYVSGDAAAVDGAGGFPVGIKHIQPIVQMSSANSGMVGIKFDLGLTLADFDTPFEATTTLTIGSKIALKNRRPAWEGGVVQLNKVRVKGELGPADIDGEIEFYSNDQKFGDGLRGGVEASIMAGGSNTKVKSEVLFGKTNGFNYFYVDFNYMEAPPKIQLCKFVALAGFGGGIYYNVRQNPFGEEIVRQTNVADRYTPQQGVYGFTGNIILSDNTGKLYAMKGILNASLQPNMAPNSISIEVKGAAFPNSLENPIDKAIVEFWGGVGYDFRQKILSATLWTKMKMPSLSEVLNPSPPRQIFSLLADFQNDRGYLKIGGIEPHNRLAVQMPDLKPLVSLPPMYSYLMIGNDGIPALADPPQKIKEALAKRRLHLAQIETTQGLDYRVLFGGAFGTPYNQYEFLFVKAGFGAELGFDVALQKFDTDCNGNEGGAPIGFNGWYASGQVYAYVAGDMSVFIEMWKIKDEFKVAGIEAGAILRGGFPSPTWVQGTVYLNYEVMGGTISGGLDFQFGFGENNVQECNAQSKDPLKGMKVIASVNPAHKDEDVDIGRDIAVSFNLPVGTPFKVNLKNANGQEQTHEFHIMVTKMEVRRKDNNALFAALDYTVPSAKQLKLTFSNQNYLGTFYTSTAFDPQTEYRILLTLSCIEVATGLVRGTPQELGEHVFKTGDCIDDIGKYLVSSYPLPMQRYFISGEIGETNIELSKDFPCLFNAPSGFTSTIEVVFFDGTTIQTMSAQKDGDMIKFTKPALQKNTTYRMMVSQTITRSAGLAGLSLAFVDRNVYTKSYSDRYGAKQASADVKTSQISGSSSGASVKTLWTTYFKTSQYATFAEKMSAFSNNVTATQYSQGMYRATYYNWEGFDEYDAIGHLRSKAGSQTREPLVTILESQDRSMGASPTSWTQNVLKPTYRAMNLFLSATGKQPVVVQKSVRITQYEPRLSMIDVPNVLKPYAALEKGIGVLFKL